MSNVIYYEVQKPEVNQIIKPEFLEVISNARTRQQKVVTVDGMPVEITKPFPSPIDWRDHPIYFLMIDRFNNPDSAPNKVWDEECWEFQGGKINGIRNQEADRGRGQEGCKREKEDFVQPVCETEGT